MKRKDMDELIFMGDFETTVYEGQEKTEVWASGLVEIKEGADVKDCIIHNNIDDTFKYLKSLRRNVTVFYHNLKFDGSFWLSYLYENGYKYGLTIEEGKTKRKKPKEMVNKELTTFISDRGQWYTITVKTSSAVITFVDSLKLLPFSVKEIAKGFNTKYQKSVIEYTGFRFAYGEITDEEREYLARDLLIPAEALNHLFKSGFKKKTIGSNALHEYKNILGIHNFNEIFPDMSRMESPVQDRDLDNYIRNAYHGGWCYVVEGKENKVFKNGCTADVNSLYPSVMHDKNKFYPVGRPKFFYGNIPEHIENREDIYYFIRIKTRFYLKENYLPFIQIKGTPYYNPVENLKTSDVKIKGKYYRNIRNLNGDLEECKPILTLTKTDYILLKEHYNLEDTEILDGVYYHTLPGNILFGDYINKWAEIKKNSKGARRMQAKLALNSLYGKYSTNRNSSWKLPINNNGVLDFEIVEEQDKKLIQVSVGAAITSYARDFTIRAAQQNYYGKDEPGFIYADTDSIHCDIPVEYLTGIEIHDKNFNCWKIENEWDEAIFVRQKTYIEHNIKADGVECTPYYNIKCAGMNDKCKDLLRLSLGDSTITLNDFIKKYIKIDNEQLEFIKEKRDITDFKKGLTIRGKLLPKLIKGGTILIETYFSMR